MLADRQREWEREFRKKNFGEGEHYISNDMEEIYLRQLYLLAIIADQLNALIRDY